MPIKVFISYQWLSGADLRSLLVMKLKAMGNVEVLIDREFIPPSAAIHEEISDAIDKCNCVLVSETSLESGEVASELIRAHDRGKTIYLISKNGDAPATFPTYLHFLSDKRRFQYNNFEELAEELQKFFSEKTENFFETIPTEIRQLTKQLKDYKSLPRFKSALIKRVLGEAEHEIRKISSDNYSVDVGTEKNFLIRAKSLFANAQSVYAISIDTVSTFWTNEHNRKLAESYINHQPANTVRLFVFSSPKVAHHYRKILQASHNRYGNDGAVLICSTTSYESLLSLTIGKAKMDKYLSQDFAILHHDSVILEAMLNHSELSFTTLSETDLGETGHRALIATLETVKGMKMTDVYTDGAESLKIKKWNKDCMDDDSLWAEDLRRLFPEERSGDVCHLVFLKDHDQELAGSIAGIKIRLEREKERLCIESVWLGKKAIVGKVNDGILGGALKIRDEFDYLIIVRFSNATNLKRYYEEHIHADIRSDLYKKLDVGIDFLMRHAEKFDRINRASIFESVIEELAGKYVVRQDFIDKEDIDSIVKALPASFGYRVD